MIVELLAFINIEVFEPALNSNINPELKKELRKNRTKLTHFKKCGDLYRYFTKVLHVGDTKEKKIFQELKLNGLKTFEDILPEINQRFRNFLKDVTGVDELIEDDIYTKIEICCLANNFNQFVGMWEINTLDDNTIGIIAAIKLKDGPYPNEWLEDDKLKYYPQKIESRSLPRTSTLAFESDDLPFYIFQNNGGNKYRYCGKFKKDINAERSSEFVILEKSNDLVEPVYMTAEKFYKDFDNKVSESLNKSTSELLNEMEVVSRTPQNKYVVVKQFNRNPVIKALTLQRAQGVCERCDRKAPFNKPNFEPYLEVHHLIMLANKGEDALYNTIALCPTCHRELHFGLIGSLEVTNLQLKIIKINSLFLIKYKTAEVS